MKFHQDVDVGYHRHVGRGTNNEQDILYGQIPARAHAAMDQRRVEVDDLGVARHYDRYGQLEKIVVTPEVMRSHGKYSRSGVMVMRVDGIRFDSPAEIYVCEGKLHREPDPTGETGPALIDLSSKRRVWYKHGKIHRDPAPTGEVGPAMIKKDGSEHWYHENEKHRGPGPSGKIGPAVIEADGTKVWMQHGKKHRLDGPAVLRSDGGEEWWQDGRQHRDSGPLLPSGDPVVLDGSFQPAVIGADGYQAWYRFGAQHREPEDGPAVINPDGSREYRYSGSLHRVDGPAVENPQNPEQDEFYFHGQQCAGIEELLALKAQFSETGTFPPDKRS